MNPILQSLQNMPINNALQMINNLRKSTNDPNALLQTMLNTNPQFRAFMQANQGKTPEQIAQENGIDLQQILTLLK